MKAFDRLASLVVGLAVAAAAAIAGIEAVLLVAGQPALIVPRASWDRYLAGATWASTWIEIPAIVALAVGAVIAVAQLIPRRPLRLAARSSPGRDVWVSRRGLAARTTAAVSLLAGVTDAQATVTRRRVKAQVTADDDRAPSERRDEVAQAIQAAVGDLGVRIRKPPRIKVRIAAEKLR